MKSLVTALLTGAGLALAPVALADGSDDQFLSALAAAGIPAHDGIPGVIAHGHKVCDVLGAGMSPGEAANELAHHAYAEDPSHPFEHRADLRWGERFRQVVERPPAHRFDGRVD